MKVNFNQDNNLRDNEIKVEVSANLLSQPVIDLINNINSNNSFSKTLPISIGDSIRMIQFADIIAIEVLKNNLTIHTFSQEFEIKGQLKSILLKLPENDFVQVSKSAVINLDCDWCQPRCENVVFCRLKNAVFYR